MLSPYGSCAHRALRHEPGSSRARGGPSRQPAVEGAQIVWRVDVEGEVRKVEPHRAGAGRGGEPEVRQARVAPSEHDADDAARPPEQRAGPTIVGGDDSDGWRAGARRAHCVDVGGRRERQVRGDDERRLSPGGRPVTERERGGQAWLGLDEHLDAWAGGLSRRVSVPCDDYDTAYGRGTQARLKDPVEHPDDKLPPGGLVEIPCHPPLRVGQRFQGDDGGDHQRQGKPGAGAFCGAA